MTKRTLMLFLALWILIQQSVIAATYQSDFGGDGSSGNVTQGTAVESDPKVVNARNYTVSAGNTYEVKSGTIINATHAVTINGTLTVSADIPGGIGANLDRAATEGLGPGGGVTGSTGPNTATGVAASGGSAGGVGGDGGHKLDISAFYPPSRPAIGIFPGITGSGGAGGGCLSCSSTSVGGNGGYGGGRVSVLAVGSITIAAAGKIQANGAAGQAATGSASVIAGGAGGSGGVIILASRTSITNNGVIEVLGGAGGDGGGTNKLGGGGGAGGIVVFWAPTISAGTVSRNGGAGGLTTSGSNFRAAQPGGLGRIILVTGKPTLPLFCWLQEHIQEVIADRRDAWTAEQLAELASGGDRVKLAYLLEIPTVAAR